MKRESGCGWFDFFHCGKPSTNFEWWWPLTGVVFIDRVKSNLEFCCHDLLPNCYFISYYLAFGLCLWSNYLVSFRCMVSATNIPNIDVSVWLFWWISDQFDRKCRMKWRDLIIVCVVNWMHSWLRQICQRENQLTTKTQWFMLYLKTHTFVVIWCEVFGTKMLTYPVCHILRAPMQTQMMQFWLTIII